MSERWLSVVGYEGLYEVSDQGRVRSLPRKAWCGGDRYRLTSARVLRPGLVGTGPYPAVKLSRNGEAPMRKVHRLVLEAFRGPCPPGMEACHGPRGRLCAALDNLRWDTKEENSRDKRRQGRPLGGNPYGGRGLKRNARGQFVRRVMDTLEAA